MKISAVLPAPLSRSRKAPRVVSTAARVTLVAVVLSITLAGCSDLFSPPRPAAELRTGGDVITAIEAVPGVALVQLGSGPDGLPGQNEINASVIINPGYTPATDVLLDYVLRQMWSQNETHITTTVSIHLFTGTAEAPESATPIDLIPALTKLGITNYDSDPTHVSYLGYQLGTTEMAKHYGKWPGPVPKLPAALAGPAVTPTVVPTPTDLLR
jgi:hypothetical protein